MTVTTFMGPAYVGRHCRPSLPVQIARTTAGMWSRSAPARLYSRLVVRMQGIGVL